MSHRFLLVLCLAFFACQTHAKDPERIKTESGQTIIKGFYDDGTLKTVTRLHPDGHLLGILHHTPKGIPTHADYYDDNKRIRRILYYRDDAQQKPQKSSTSRARLFWSRSLIAMASSPRKPSQNELCRAKPR